MRGRAMILRSVPRGWQSRCPRGPLGQRPLEAVDLRPRHPAGAVKRKVQAEPHWPDEEPGFVGGAWFGYPAPVPRVSLCQAEPKDSFYRSIDTRRLSAHKIGRLWKFKLTAVDEWVRAGGVDAHDQDDKTDAR